MANYCVDCGKKITGKRRCWDCHVKNPNKPQRTLEWRQAHSKKVISHYDEVGRKSKDRCIDCGKEVSWKATRCRRCWEKLVSVKPNFCIDCGKTISQAAMRCVSCALIYRYNRDGRKPKNCCIDCGEKISWGATRCQSCAYKDPERSHKLSERAIIHRSLRMENDVFECLCGYLQHLTDHHRFVCPMCGRIWIDNPKLYLTDSYPNFDTSVKVEDYYCLDFVAAKIT